MREAREASTTAIATNLKYQMSLKDSIANNFYFAISYIPENQNYLNYQQGQQQGRFLSSFPQSSRNGFFPVQRQGQQPQAGSYQQQDLYLDGPSTPFFNSFQPFAVSFDGKIGFKGENVD